MQLRLSHLMCSRKCACGVGSQYSCRDDTKGDVLLPHIHKSLVGWFPISWSWLNNTFLFCTFASLQLLPTDMSQVLGIYQPEIPMETLQLSQTPWWIYGRSNHPDWCHEAAKNRHINRTHSIYVIYMIFYQVWYWPLPYKIYTCMIGVSTSIYKYRSIYMMFGIVFSFKQFYWGFLTSILK